MTTKIDEAARLKAAGLRPTRQRIELARLLFTGHDRHVTAESLAEEGSRAGVKVSLATVYNTLHQFQAAGLLREVVQLLSESHDDRSARQSDEARRYLREMQAERDELKADGAAEDYEREERLFADSHSWRRP